MNKGDLVNEVAKELINGYLALEGERVTLMKSFFPVLPCCSTTFFP